MNSSPNEHEDNEGFVVDSLATFLDEIRQFPLLSAEEEKELALRYRSGDEAAVKRLASCNLRLVVSIAKEYSGRGVPLLDLISGGHEGLMLAACKFDPDRECRFSTYATDWIHRGVRTALKQNGSLIHVTNYGSDRIRKVQEARSALEKENGEPPTEREIAERCGFSEETVRELLGYNTHVSSIDDPVGEDGVRLDLLENAESEQPERKLAREELNRILELLLSQLDERQQLVIRLHFGMEDGECHSFESIGKRLGISKERVRQIENSAKERLKKLGVNFGLEDFLDE